jgi:phosphopantetheinyl transferase
MIDVWCLLDHAVAGRAVAGHAVAGHAAAGHTLDEAERERAGRFLCPASAATYRAAHAVKRRVLSHYRPDVAPADWRFTANAWGKPAVAALHPAPAFNLSHGGGAIALAVADAEVGVDIERVRPLAHADAVGRHVFHPLELAWLGAQPEPLRAFFVLWTKKEALLKAAGTGFSHPARELAWQGLDEPWALATFGGRTWVGATRLVDDGTILSVAVPLGSDLRAARLLRLAPGGLDASGELVVEASGFVPGNRVCFAR